MDKLTNTTKDTIRTFTMLAGHDPSIFHIRFKDNSKYAGKSLYFVESEIRYCDGGRGFEFDILCG